MSLVTLENVKTFLGITGTSKDSLLNLLIPQASSMFETLVDRTFDQTTYTNEEYDGSGNREIQLDHYPVITFTMLEKRNTFDNKDDWEEINSTDYWVDNDTGIITRTTNFLDWDTQYRDPELSTEIQFELGKRNYRATYTAGYAEIPQDVQGVVMMMIGELVNTRNKGGIESETLGDHTIRLAKSGLLETSYVSKVIAKYKDAIIC